MADIYVATTGNDATGTGAAGTPYATPGKGASVAAAGDVVLVKAGTYTLTTATPGAGGPVRLSAGSDSAAVLLVGYDTTATATNADANRPIIVVGAGLSSLTVVAAAASYAAQAYRNLVVDAAGRTGVTGFAGGTDAGNFERCKAVGCDTGFFSCPTTDQCWADACGTGFSACVRSTACASRGHTVRGFIGAAGSYSRNLACLGAGAAADGFVVSTSQAVLSNCTSAGNGRDGLVIDTYSRSCQVNGVVSFGNGGYGVKVVVNSATSRLRGNATGSNTSGNELLMYAGQSVGAVTLTADPFANSAGAASATTLDALFACYAPNTTAGGGALLRATGYPASLDIGCVQHADPAGGGGGSGYCSLQGVG